ncbi:hypothetical protein OBBRIDRAFT_791683 [Obba rivulosa]|uniref:Hydantoin racemase n=1 Tax=Obba rivulosa TaxID=1052685 RepID=A0A8E2DME2_9APHY|nr:hypothetical protein OBBRIDRAFT_791683 [Obba rivulosa]
MASTPASTSILIINPNSTRSMTAALAPLLADLTHPGLALHFHTGPPDAPPSINDAETSAASAAATLPSVLPLLAAHDAVLVACFSEHPLVPMLRTHLASSGSGLGTRRKPVLGIFEASVLHARALGRPFGIVTTGSYWEAALSRGVRGLFGSGDVGGSFVGVCSTGLSALELHEMPADEVRERIACAAQALVGERDAEVVIMGCAGMSGMKDAVREGARQAGREEVVILDAVRCGVGMLDGMLRAMGRD